MVKVFLLMMVNEEEEEIWNKREWGFDTKNEEEGGVVCVMKVVKERRHVMLFVY